jgi:predicted nicotinamide N-methyase
MTRTARRLLSVLISLHNAFTTASVGRLAILHSVIAGTQPEPQEIVLGTTRLGPVPLVPEILLHQASEPMSAWEHTELATGLTGLDPPFWAFAWPGGQALARYVLDHRDAVLGRRVIDIASGSGLVAVAAAIAGAAAVTGYDIDPLAAAAIEVNAAANGVLVAAVCADVLTEAPACPAPALALAADPALALAADVVLVADAFYTDDLAARVVAFLERADAGGAAVLVGDFGRKYLPRARLTPLASYDVPGLRALEGTDIKRTSVWAFGRSRAAS